MVSNSRQVFVTGGTGFLGRHLVPTLLRSGYQVRLLARAPQKHAWLARYPQVDVIAGDVQVPETFADSMRGCQLVIHAAGRFRFWGDDASFDRINVGGTHNVLQTALDHGVERVVHVSTIAVVGQPDPSRIVDETHPAHPVDPYQRSKLRGEALAMSFNDRGLPVVIARPGAFYGPMGQYAFNRLFFRDPMRGIIMQVNRGRYVTFPVYIGDAASGIILCAERGRAGEIYNLCGESLTHREAFDIICAEASLHFPRITIPGWMGVAAARVLTAISAITRREPFYPINLRSYVYNYWRCSNEKARRELGFEPLPFDEGARRTIAWYRAGQPDMLPELEY